MALSVDILVLGATGFVGRLVTKEINSHSQRTSFTFALGARSSTKLAALVSELDLNAQIPLVTIDVNNADDLERAVKSAKVVLNTVGPFWNWGTQVVATCARNGVHYVDITGETAWIKEMIEKYDHLASKTHSVIVHSCGVDSLPSDFAVYLSVRTLKEHLGSEVEATKSVTALSFKTGVSRGTLSSIYTFLAETPRSKAAESLQDHSISPAAGAPSPPTRLLYTLPYVHPRISGGFFVMSITNRAIIQRTRGLLEVHPSMQHARYGPNFNYEEFAVAPNWIVGVCMSLTIYVITIALSSSRIVQWLFKRFVVDRIHGPSDEEMEKGFLTATNVTSAAGPGRLEAHAKTVIRLRGDPGYLCTAVMVVECAVALLDTSKLTVLAREGGILTPVTAFGDELIKRLERTERFRFERTILPP